MTAINNTPVSFIVTDSGIFDGSTQATVTLNIAGTDHQIMLQTDEDGDLTLGSEPELDAETEYRTLFLALGGQLETDKDGEEGWMRFDHALRALSGWTDLEAAVEAAI